MADFPITRARESLGFTPSTSVRGGQIDTSTGGVELGKAMSRLGQTVTEIVKRREQMQDANSSAQADRLRALADEEFLQFKATNPQEEWEEFRRGQTERVAQEVAALPFSRNTKAKEQINSKTHIEISTAKALTAATLQLRTDTIDSLTEAMTDAFRSGDPEKILKAVTAFKDNGNNMGKDVAEVLSDVKAAKAAGEKLRIKDQEGVVFALAMTLPIEEGIAIINASGLPLDSIKSIRSEYTIQKGIQRDQVTSDTIREYFAGQLTVDILNERHAAGLIKDAEFKSMMTGLTGAVREHSDPFAKGNIRRANADFAAGAITREEADKIVLANYDKLNGTDRSNVVADLEDVETKIIATAKSNAYDEGKGLMSRRFVGIQTEEDLIDLFRGAGLTEEEKARINRLFTAEVNNRDLYERAIDDRFREMRKEGISDINKYKAESLSILLQYQRRKQLTLEELETKVKREQRGIVAEAPSEFVGPPAPTIKPIDKMSTEEKQRELERIRELKRLAK